MLAKAAELTATEGAKAQERPASGSFCDSCCVMGSLRKSARGASAATVTSAALAASPRASGLPAVTVASPPAVPVKLSYSNGSVLDYICDREGRFSSLQVGLIFELNAYD